MVILSSRFAAGFRPGRALCAALIGVALPLHAAPPLATGVVALREVERSVAADGVIEAIRYATLAAQVSGRIVELRVKAGDAVSKGQVLARIDDRETAQTVASVRAQIARAEADLGNARANLERNTKLVASKFVSPAALDKAQADYDAAQAQLAAARAATAQAQAVHGHTVITAPFSGVVSERLAELGETAQPGRPLYSLFDPKELRATANIAQIQIQRLQRLLASGAQPAASVEFPPIGQRVKAKRVTVLPSAEPRTHTTQVRIDLPDAPLGAYPGQFVRVHFSVGREQKLTIPASAVVHRSEVTGAYVVGDSGEIRFRQLRLGEPVGEAGIELLAGIRPGEKVALDPVAALAALKQAR